MPVRVRFRLPLVASLAAVLAVATAGFGADSAGGIAEAALAPRSGPRGATLFTQLSAEQTGIVTENRYDDPKMWGERYQEFALGAIGTGVAIGDYDGDGRPDVFVVSKTGRCRLFRNLGDWKFEDVTEKAGLGGAADGGVAGPAQELDRPGRERRCRRFRRGLEAGGGVRRREQRRPAGPLRLPVQRPQSALHQPGRRDVQGGGGGARAGGGRRVRDGAPSATTTATAGSMSTSRRTCSTRSRTRTGSGAICSTTTATARSPT